MKSRAEIREVITAINSEIDADQNSEYRNALEWVLDTEKDPNNMTTKENWNTFRKSGLLLIINQFLHIFGWSICVKFSTYNERTDDGTIVDVYPARVKFRGFDEKSTSKAYLQLSEYMDKNSKELLDEAKN